MDRAGFIPLIEAEHVNKDEQQARCTAYMRHFCRRGKRKAGASYINVTAETGDSKSW